MKFFYLANFLIEKNNESESITVLNSLIPLFPNSFFLLNSLAHAYYLLHEYETSLEYFEKLFQLDPHRYENLDTYSNILFIKENYSDVDVPPWAIKIILTQEELGTEVGEEN